MRTRAPLASSAAAHLLPHLVRPWVGLLEGAEKAHTPISGEAGALLQSKGEFGPHGIKMVSCWDPASRQGRQRPQAGNACWGPRLAACHRCLAASDGRLEEFL